MINVIVSDELIKKLISSESSAVHAHWIKGTFLDITCSNCGFWIRVSDSLIPKMAYCPHCGAKMDEQQNDIED